MEGPYMGGFGSNQKYILWGGDIDREEYGPLLEAMAGYAVGYDWLYHYFTEEQRKALKAYLENITVSGITFEYSDQGIPQSLCKAKTLHYVTTSGGYIGQNDFGFSYVKALAKNFFGINENHFASGDIELEN